MKKSKILILCLAAVVVVLVAGIVIAAPTISSYTVDWWVFSGGGAPSSVGDYRLNGSLGQSVIGESSSTNYGIDHGYWGKGWPYGIFLPMILK
jgi:hypothetical protein